MKKTSLAVLSIAVLLTVAALAADVSGTWVMSRPGRGGEMMESDITIAQTGNAIKVTMPGRPSKDGTPGEPMVADGTVEGNAIQWKVVRQTPRGEMTMEYKGTVDGATMKGTFTMMDREVEWTAKKK